MTDGFTVNLDELAALLTRMTEFERHLRGALEHADDHVRNAHRVWSGAAADAHRAAHRQWHEGADRMHEGLAAMRRIAETAHRNYTAAITANTQMWD